MKIATRRFVRPEFMNHHQTLYAGYISEWLTEAAMIGVTEVMGETEHVDPDQKTGQGGDDPGISLSAGEIRDYKCRNTG